MNTHETMLTNDPVLTSQIANKGFAILDALFHEKGWHLIKNEMNWITYTIRGNECAYFDIKILPDKIVASVPVKNSTYQYVTSFTCYYEASEYVEQKLMDFIACAN